jgi:hypothetical protein
MSPLGGFPPPSLNKANYEKYRQSSSVTDFKEFTGRTHFIIRQTGWEEVADYVLAWLNDKGDVMPVFPC